MRLEERTPGIIPVTVLKEYKKKLTMNKGYREPNNYTYSCKNNSQDKSQRISTRERETVRKHTFKGMMYITDIGIQS